MTRVASTVTVDHDYNLLIATSLTHTQSLKYHFLVPDYPSTDRLTPTQIAVSATTPSRPKATMDAPKSQATASETSKMEIKPTSSSSVAHSPLFKLPPELRDIIYDYAFSRPALMAVTKEAVIPEPPLLFTCKTVRAEAIKPFYERPRFLLVVHSHDSAVMMLWLEKGRALMRAYKAYIAPQECWYSGPRSWSNLKRSLQLHSQNPEMSLDAGVAGSPGWTDEAAFIQGLFQMTRAMKDQAWEKVEGILDMLRLGLVKFDWDWLD